MRKGYKAERELFNLLLQKGYAVVRVAGSGNPLTPCDLIAGNIKNKVCVEIKESKDERKYIKKEQVDMLVNFSKKFGLKPFVAIKFKRKGWKFFSLEDLDKVESFFVAKIEKGKNFLE